MVNGPVPVLDKVSACSPLTVSVSCGWKVSVVGATTALGAVPGTAQSHAQNGVNARGLDRDGTVPDSGLGRVKVDRYDASCSAPERGRTTVCKLVVGVRCDGRDGQRIGSNVCK